MRKVPSQLRPLTTADMAVCLNTSLNNIGQLVREQILTRNGDGLFDPAVNFPAYLRHLAEGLKSRWSADGEDRKLLTSVKAQREMLKLGIEQRELVRVSDITLAYAAMVERCRTRLLGIARKIAPRWAVAKTAIEAEGIIRREVEAALMELSQLPQGEPDHGAYNGDGAE